ncbi:MAG TPA: FAD-dependent oxidoreductase, partial [Trueperaceae bacterium]|nr:FAD-dependent oxidoreductase [Trueperaceae bacterium]
MNRAHKYDVLVVGAGGAGMMAARYAVQNPNVTVAVVTKLYPTRSHTGAAQGGVGAALGNISEDKPIWHAYDTVKGGDYLTDQDVADMFSRDAIDAVYELEHMGLPFSRTADGKIAQRKFGGHTKEFGKAPVERACYAADRTGHMILQTLYQQSIKNNVTFFNEFHVLDLIMDDGICKGVVAYELATGELHTFQAKSTIIASGGAGRMFKTTSNAHALTGDM